MDLNFLVIQLFIISKQKLFLFSHSTWLKICTEVVFFSFYCHPVDWFVLLKKHRDVTSFCLCLCVFVCIHQATLFFKHRVNLWAKQLISQWRPDGGLCFQVRRRSAARRWMSCLWSCRFCGRAVKSISSSDTMRFSSCAARQCWMSLSFQPLNNVLVLWETLLQTWTELKF